MKAVGLTTVGAALSCTWGKLSMAANVLKQEIFKQKAYQGLRGLADYPYFEMTDNGLLRLTVDGLEGGIDGHTHLALNSFAGGKPDLLKSHPKTRYCLPPDIKTSLYLYANQNASAEEKKATWRELMKSTLLGGSEVAETHTIPNLLAEMDLMGIEKAVMLPIHFGWLFNDNMTEKYMAAIEKSGTQDRFILCGSVKPTLKNASQKVKEYHALGLKGIKLHPNFAKFFPNHKDAWPVYDMCAKLNLPVLIHCGRTGYKEKRTLGMKLYSEDYSDIHNFEEPIAAFPEARFVLCHAGALQNEQAIEIAKKHKNVWLDIHGQGVSRIQAMIKEVGAERLMYGSDWAFYPEAAILLRLLIATENDHTVRRMLFADNARRFWGIV